MGGVKIFWCCNHFGGYFENWLGLKCASTGPFNSPLWYLRDLIVISYLTPLLYFLIKRFKIWFFIPILLMYFGDINIPFQGLSTSTILFFGLGSYIAINKGNLICTFRRFEIPCYIIAASFFILATIYQGDMNEIGHYYFCVYVIFGAISTFNIGSRIIERKKVKINPVLVGSVFFIYAFHTNWFVGIYESIIIRVFKRFGFDYINLLTYITTPFIKAALCIVVYMFIKKSFPGIAKVLNGGR